MQETSLGIWTKFWVGSVDSEHLDERLRTKRGGGGWRLLMNKWNEQSVQTLLMCGLGEKLI